MSKQTKNITNQGGSKVGIALFGLLAIGLAIIAFYEGSKILPQDNLVGLIPDTSMVYVHESVDTTRTPMLQKLVPPNIVPSEIAIFAIPTTENRITWITALKIINPTDTNWLISNNWSQISPNVLINTQMTPEQKQIIVSQPKYPSLLTQLRNQFRIQGFYDYTALNQAGINLPSLFSSQNKTFFGGNIILNRFNAMVFNENTTWPIIAINNNPDETNGFFINSSSTDGRELIAKDLIIPKYNETKLILPDKSKVIEFKLPIEISSLIQPIKLNNGTCGQGLEPIFNVNKKLIQNLALFPQILNYLNLNVSTLSVDKSVDKSLVICGYLQ